MYLVDTNVLSELLRPRPSADVVRWLQSQTAVALSVITVEELAYGVARAPAPKRAKLAQWLDGLLESAVHTFEVTEAIAKAAGELRAARERGGRRVAQADMLTAATALVHGLTLATRNARDFVDCGIAIVDPFSR